MSLPFSFRYFPLAAHASVFAALGVSALTAQSASGWTGAAGDGLWSTAANWSAGVPGGATATADFSGLDLTADITVGVEAVTVNRLVFGDTAPGGGNWYLGDPLFSYTFTLAGAEPTITVGDLGTNLVSFNSGGGPLHLAAANGFIKDGPGRLDLSGNNTLGGRIVVRAGTLGGPNGAVLNSAAAVELAGGHLALGSGSVTFAAPLELSATGSLTFGNNSKTITGAISGPAGVALTIGQSSGASSTISLAGNLSAYRGELVLSSRYYRLDTAYATSFAASGAGAIWTINTGATGAASGDGALFYRNGTNTTVTFALGALQGSGVLRGGGAAGTGTVIYEIGALGLDTTFSGLVRDGALDTTVFTKAGITKVGAGSLTLSGANAYTGATTVSAGSLVVNGDQSLATGALTVAAGATLRGIGVLGAPATITGTLAPGLAATSGTLTTRADLTFAAGSTLRLRATAAAHDTLVLVNPDTTGATPRTLTLGGTLRLEVADETAPGEITLINRDALVSLSGDFAAAEVATGAGATALQTLDGVWVGEAGDRTYAFDPETGKLVIASGSAPTALESWRQQHFGVTAPEGDAADLADPDHDGLPNLLEYAFDADPRAATVSPLVLGRDASGHLTLTFPIRADAGLIYTVQASDDLVSWPPIFADDGLALSAGGATTHTVSDPETLAAHPRRFLRLLVDLAP